MIVEVRTCTTKLGLRGRFLDLFQQEAVPLQRSLGIRIVGPFISVGNPDVFAWIRAFPSPTERDLMRDALYQGEKWKGKLEATIVPLLDEYEVVVADIPEWLANDLPTSPDQISWS